MASLNRGTRKRFMMTDPNKGWSNYLLSIWSHETALHCTQMDRLSSPLINLSERSRRIWTIIAESDERRTYENVHRRWKFKWTLLATYRIKDNPECSLFPKVLAALNWLRFFWLTGTESPKSKSAYTTAFKSTSLKTRWKHLCTGLLPKWPFCRSVANFSS